MKNEKMNDIMEMTDWLEEQIKNIENEGIETGEVEGYQKKEEVPVLYHVIMGDEKKLDEKAKKRYKKYLDGIKNQTSVGLATASGRGISAALLAGSGMAVGGSAGWVGQSLIMGGALSVGLPVVSWLIPVALAGGALAVSKKNQKGPKREKKDDFEKRENWYNFCMEKVNILSEELENSIKRSQEMFKENFLAALTAIQKESEKIKINIDDALNMDQNKRIMQYQEIVLKQYKTQMELRKALKTLMESYNTLVKEKQELEQKIEAYSRYGIICYIMNNSL